MVRGDRRSAEALREVAASALGQPAGVDEHQGRAMFGHQLGQPVVDLLPGFVAQHRFQRHGRHFDGEVALAAVAHIHQRAGVAPLAHEKGRHALDGLLRGRQADALHAAPAQRFQAFGAEHQMAAALAAGDGVNFIDDQAATPGQHGAAGFGTEQDVERFRRGDQDVRRAFAHGVALGLGRIASAHGGADIHIRQALARQLGTNAGQRFFQVDADVVGQRLQRRDVDHRAAIRQPAVLQPLVDQFVDGREKGGEGLARARGGSHQCARPGPDGRPGEGLGRRRSGEAGAEPGGDGGVENLQRGRCGSASRSHGTHYGGRPAATQGGRTDGRPVAAAANCPQAARACRTNGTPVLRNPASMGLSANWPE